MTGDGGEIGVRAGFGVSGGEETGAGVEDSFAEGAVSVRFAGAVVIWAEDKRDSVHGCGV